jgi:hypothetical protein
VRYGTIGGVRSVLVDTGWRDHRAAHERRVDAWLAGHLDRRRAGTRHPVEDFLFARLSDFLRRPAAARSWTLVPPIRGVSVQDLARRYQPWPVGHPQSVQIGRHERALAVAEGAATTHPPQKSESRVFGKIKITNALPYRDSDQQQWAGQ